jgi:hypothetical protein
LFLKDSSKNHAINNDKGSHLSWAIQNSLKGWVLYDLTEREIQLLVRTMSINEVRLTRVCKQSDTTWQTLSENQFPELFKFTQGESKLFPVLEPPKEGSDTEYFVIRPQKTIHPRLHKRYETEITCLIFSTTRQFTTATIDLSEGGLYFKDMIPDWVVGYFIVGVQGPGALFQLMCSLVEDQKEKKRVQIVSEEQDPQFVAYKEWLLTL